MNLLLAFLVAIFFAVAYYAIKKISEGSGQSASTISTSTRISSLSSKLSLPNIKIIVIVAVVLILSSAIFICIVGWVPGALNYYLNRTQEEFDDNNYKYNVHFNSDSGQASTKKGRLLIFGEVNIMNDDVLYLNPNFGCDIWVAKGKTALIEVTFRDMAITRETTFNFTIEGRRSIQKLEFGVDSQNQVWAEVNGREPNNFKKGSGYFNTNVPYNVIFTTTGDRGKNSVYIDNLKLGAFWRL